MNLKSTYNKIAKDWYSDHKSDDWWNEGTDTFISFLGKGVVLDVGCGGGTKSQYLIQKGLNVVGIDFSEGLLDIARKNVPGTSFLLLDMREVSTLNQKFDGVFTQASLLHIPKKEIQKTIDGLVSVLKQNGYLYIAVKEAKRGKPDEEIKKENDYGYEYERFFSYFTMEELNNYLASSGLEVVYKKANQKGKTNWLQIIGKK